MVLSSTAINGHCSAVHVVFEGSGDRRARVGGHAVEAIRIRRASPGRHRPPRSSGIGIACSAGKSCCADAVASAAVAGYGYQGSRGGRGSYWQACGWYSARPRATRAISSTGGSSNRSAGTRHVVPGTRCGSSLLTSFLSKSRCSHVISTHRPAGFGHCPCCAMRLGWWWLGISTRWRGSSTIPQPRLAGQIPDMYSRRTLGQLDRHRSTAPVCVHETRSNQPCMTHESARRQHTSDQKHYRPRSGIVVRS